jgi:DnaJ-related protein SCJ1|eukprot:TRINITY_DN3171_c0_g4_i2.p1 TRINITY_DN3171_c0_g4~~TRINITY_DN3171_c0_g4_i2.p1  ORF type:complete len:366 (+),score=200.00 TRINITY_DN3171_c0_g4_i2:267-1364(+)
MRGFVVVAVLAVVLAVSAVLGADRDFYAILGVPRDATGKQIKKAYKSLSLRFHPDKADGSEEAKARFVEVAEAYEVLGDEEKRQIYDQFGEEGLKSKQQGGGGGGNDIFSQFGFNFGGGGNRGPKKGEDVTVKLPVSLADIYLGREMEVAFQKQVLCPGCRGSGAENPNDVETCSVCKGQGVIIQHRQLGPGFVQQVQQQCHHCGGRGKIIKSKCKKCQGTKVSTAQKLETVLVERGTPDGHVITLSRAADDRPGETSGDVKFVVATQRHPKFSRSGNNLHYQATISLVEALTGFSFGINHLDGHVVTVTSDKIVRPGQVIRMRGEGMPLHGTPSEHGDLLVTITVAFPAELSKDQQAEIKRILA